MDVYKAKVNVRLKDGILDPQGKAIQSALQSLGFEEIENLRTGKLIEFDIHAENEKNANAAADKACRQLLANPVIEDFTYKLTKPGDGNA